MLARLLQRLPAHLVTPAGRRQLGEPTVGAHEHRIELLTRVYAMDGGGEEELIAEGIAMEVGRTAALRWLVHLGVAFEEFGDGAIDVRLEIRGELLHVRHTRSRWCECG